MYDVLVYVYENYFTPATCPKPEDLAKRLVAAGFEHDDIHDAMSWLHRLSQNTATQKDVETVITTDSTRMYNAHEQYKLGINGISFLYFMESTGALSPSIREAIINCALDAPQDTLILSEFKILVLMVMWSQEQEVNDLLLDELIQHNGAGNILH